MEREGVSEGDSLAFLDSGSRLGEGDSRCVSLADLDGDGDLDALVANADEPSRLWLNNADGSFRDSEKELPQATCVAVGDMDLDGDLDAVITGTRLHLLRNDGVGGFTSMSVKEAPEATEAVALEDLDGDGDLDAFVANRADSAHFPVPNTVWLNRGDGWFGRAGRPVGRECSSDVALGDLDADGDLDAFVANASHAGADPANRVWLNDRRGTFSDSGQALGRSYGLSVALGDLDGDGDLDAFVGNYRSPDRVWRNDGKGFFTDTGLELGGWNSDDVALGDLDGDGDLDALTVSNAWMGGDPANLVWLNAGKRR